MDYIEVRNLLFSYRDEMIFKDINFSIKKGEFLALIGPNGGGKSTLMKLLIGLLKPSAGEITIDNKIPSSIYSKIGYVPQNTNINLNFPITSLEVVLMGHSCKKRSLFGYSKHEIECAKSSLELLGISDKSNCKVGNLSGGERQKVFIARALCNKNTEILFLDEPTANIDISTQGQIYEILKDLNRELTIVVVSHDISIILDYASKVGYVNRSFVMHDAPSINKESLLSRLGIKGEHICEVDILRGY